MAEAEMALRAHWPPKQKPCQGGSPGFGARQQTTQSSFLLAIVFFPILLRILFQIVFREWSTLKEQKWVIFRERRGPRPEAQYPSKAIQTPARSARRISSVRI
jgi:hypothetical protein